MAVDFGNLVVQTVNTTANTIESSYDSASGGAELTFVAPAPDLENINNIDAEFLASISDPSRDIRHPENVLNKSSKIKTSQYLKDITKI